MRLLKNFPLYCPKCGHERIVSIENYILKEPDAQTPSR
ncbi:MAG: cysteine-rich KTR domain-containing protein [Sporomusa sp.]